MCNYIKQIYLSLHTIYTTETLDFILIMLQYKLDT